MIFACSRTRSAGPGRNSKPRKDRGPRESSWTELRSPSRSRARHMRVADGLAPEPLELRARIYRERATGRCDAEVWIGPFPEFIPVKVAVALCRIRISIHGGVDDAAFRQDDLAYGTADDRARPGVDRKVHARDGPVHGDALGELAQQDLPRLEVGEASRLLLHEGIHHHRDGVRFGRVPAREAAVRLSRDRGDRGNRLVDGAVVYELPVREDR